MEWRHSEKSEKLRDSVSPWFKRSCAKSFSTLCQRSANLGMVFQIFINEPLPDWKIFRIPHPLHDRHGILFFPTQPKHPIHHNERAGAVIGLAMHMDFPASIRIHCV